MANALVKTPEGRTSFMKVFKPEMNFNKTGKEYSLKLLISKKSDMSNIKNAWKSVAEKEFGTSSPKKLRPLFSAGDPEEDKGAIMDGDWKYNETEEDKKDTYEAYRGCWALGLKTPEKFPPAVVDSSKQEIMSEADFAAGDYAVAVIEMSSYTHKTFGTPQVTIRLKVLQQTREGGRFNGGSSPQSALDMLDEGTGPTDSMDALL